MQNLMNKTFTNLIFALFCTCTIFIEQASAQTIYPKIGNYKVYYGWAHNYPQDWMILRRFDNEGHNYLLMVNPQTLETKINESSFYQIKPMTMEQAREFFKSTPYQKALSKAEKQSIILKKLKN